MSEFCNICYENFHLEKLHDLPCKSKCTAKYHKKCLMNWYRRNPNENRFCLNCFEPFEENLKKKEYTMDLIHDFCFDDKFCIYMSIIQQIYILYFFSTNQGPSLMDKTLISDHSLTKNELEFIFSTFMFYYGFGYVLPFIHFIYHMYYYYYFRQLGYFSYRLNFTYTFSVCFWTIVYTSYKEYDKKDTINYSYIFVNISICVFLGYIFSTVRGQRFRDNLHFP